MPRKVNHKINTRSKTETYLVNEKYLGKDVPPNLGTSSSLARALQWHHMMSSISDAKEYAKTFLASVGKVKESRNFSKIPDTHVPLTHCWLANLHMTRWGLFDQEHLDKIVSKLCDAVALYALEPKIQTGYKPNVQESMREKIGSVIADFEDVLDSRNYDFSVYEYLLTNAIPQRYISDLIAYYAPLLEELNSITRDKQVAESYSHMNKVELASLKKFVTTMLSDFDRWGDNQKKVRKPRKKRVVSADKKVAKLKYQKTDAALKLESVSPASIIGASELWVYNTKYAKLTRYVALDRAGLDIKGQTILNYDPVASVEKRIGRKAPQILSEVLSAGKIKDRKLMDTITSKGSEASGRLNIASVLVKTKKGT
jgi:hypothetical protein